MFTEDCVEIYEAISYLCNKSEKIAGSSYPVKVGRWDSLALLKQSHYTYT